MFDAQIPGLARERFGVGILISRFVGLSMVNGELVLVPVYVVRYIWAGFLVLLKSHLCPLTFVRFCFSPQLRIVALEVAQSSVLETACWLPVAT